jgi:RNA recognition motif-containing protein
MNLYVGNLDYTVKEAQLQAMFSEFGEVSSVKVITDKMSGKSKGFAFVEMPNDDEANEAIKNLNQKTIKARPPVPKEKRPFRPSSSRDNDRFRKRF